MKREDFTVGWICALKHEFAASRAMLDEEYDAIEDGDPTDTNVYCWGRISGHQIVMACLPAGRYGIDSAAAVATNMLRTYPSFRFGLMVGIGGGVPSPDHDIRLGDVVVSKPTGPNGGVIQYDLGKALPGGRFERKGHLNKPPQVLLNAIQKLQATHDMQDPKIATNIGRMMERYPKMRRTYNFPGPGLDHFYLHDCVSLQTQNCDACAPSEMNRNDRLGHAGMLDLEPRIHYGLIGSGNKVIASAAERDKLCEGADILCFETEAAGLMDTFPCLVIRGICDYADSHKRDMWQNYAATTAAAFSHELLGITPIWAVTKTSQAEPMHLDLPSNAERDRVFEKLSIAEHAAFDSAGTTETHTQCLKDTRVDILKQILSWTDSPSDQAIFWLKGWAGTGKSTIALTIANLLSSSSGIVASFFFQRGGGDLARPTKLIPTIAHQLAVHSIEYFDLLKQAVDHDPALGKSKSMVDQYEQLIVTPLRKMKESSTQSTFIIVIDALDECEDQQTVRSVLQLLGETSSISELGLRVFVTSRPETPIRLGFENMKSVIYRDLALHDLPRAIVDEDITLYFDHQLSEIRSERRLPDNWPGRSNLDTLVLMAEGLFIFAVTACRFINGPRQISAVKRLEQVCHGVKTGQIHTRPLDKMYAMVLDNFASGDFLDEELEEVMANFREIVGAFLLTYDNLSASALKHLLFSEQERTEKSVRDILDPLHALLDIPIDNHRPIRTIHLSFRDFLLDHDRCRQERFWIKQKDMHENLFKSCIDLMSKSLHENMCNVDPAGIYVSEVVDEYISSAISPALKYACRYWFQHALDATIDLTDDGPMHYFISEHILYWLETMGWLGLVPEAVSIINDISRRVDSLASPKFQNFVHDARRFALKFCGIIARAPLQTYASLHFTPKSSILREMWLHRVSTSFDVIDQSASQWDTCLQTLEGHDMAVTVVAFSPDGAILASASDDDTVRLWDTSTGNCNLTLTGHSNGVTGLAFSHDGDLLATASFEHTFRQWDTRTGDCQIRIQLQGHADLTCSDMTFFRERLLLACAAANGDIQIWDAESATCVGMLKARDALVDSIAFSRHGSTLISTYDNYLIRLWNAYSGECIGTFEGHSADISCVALSDDGAFIASGSSDNTVRVWNTETKSCQVLKAHLNTIAFVAISCDGSKIASASEYGLYGGELRLWDAKTGSCIKLNPQDSANMTNFIFSSDASFLIVAWESEIHIWKIETGECQKIMKSDQARITTLTISPGDTTIALGSEYGIVQLWDNTLPESTAVDSETSWNPTVGITCSHDESKVATVLVDGTLVIWNVETGNCQQTVKQNLGLFSKVKFSHDDSMLASQNDHGLLSTIRIWDLSTVQPLSLLKVSDKQIADFSFSHDDLKLVSSCITGEVRIWNTQTGDCERILQTYSLVARAVIFSEDDLFVAVGYREVICIWDLETGKSWCANMGRSEDISSVLFSPDGSKLAASSEYRRVYLWDTQDLVQIRCLMTRSRKPRMRFSPDGTRLIVDGGHVSSNPTDLAQPLAEAQPLQEQSNDHCFWYDNSEEWIMRSSRGVLWLPPEFRGPKAMSGKIIAIGNDHGEVTIVRAR